MPFTKSASSILGSGGNVIASDLDVDTSGISYDTSTDFVGIGTSSPTAKLDVHDTTTSSANTGGALRLSANDGAPMGDSHRLGVIEFTGAEDSSNTQVVGARIEAITDAAWTNVENGCALYFYTTDANAVQTNVLKIDSNQKSTFTGNVEVNGDIDLTGALSFDGSAVAITEIDTDISSVAGTDTTLATAKAIKTYVDSVAGGGTSDLTDVSGTLAVGNGGTGATSLTDGGVLLGSGTGAVTATAVLTNGQLLIGDNSGDPTVATLTAGDGIDVTNGAGSITIAAEESTASNLGIVTVAGGTDCTVTYSSGTATVAVDNLAASKITSGTFADARISASSVTQHQGSITGTGTIASGTWEGTDVAVAHGGTGASTASDARTNLGLAIGSDVQAYDADLAALAGCQSGVSTAIAALTLPEVAILDGATASTTELNLLDGGTSVGGSITITDTDGFIINDGGTTKLIPASDLKTYAGGGGSAADDSNLILHMQVFA